VNFTLTRNTAGLYGIFGRLQADDHSWQCLTLEHAYDDGQSGFVPKLAPGTYTCVRYLSPGHGYALFVVKDVPDFQGKSVSFIELHVGNYNTDSKGCILLGYRLGAGCILDSRIAFEAFMDLQKNVDSFTLTVV
jgi:Family of unknown function (DUF5675)